MSSEGLLSNGGVTPDPILSQLLKSRQDSGADKAKTVQLGQYGAGQSGYDTEVNAENVNYLNELRAQSQGSLNKLGSGVVNAATQTGLDILKDTSYLLDVRNYVDFQEQAKNGFHNWFEEAMTSAEEAVKLPVYRTEASKGFSPDSAGWWADAFPSMLSTISMAVPAEGAVLMLGKLAKAITATKVVSNLEKATGVAMKLSGELSGATKGITSAVISRHMESLLEGGQTYQDTFNALEGKVNPTTGAEYTADEKRRIAGEAASNNYKANWVNLITDIPQYMLLHKSFSKTLDDMKLDWKDIAKTALSEGAEEGYQFITNEETKRAALIKAGAVSDDKSDLSDRLAEYAKDGEFWTSVTLGGLGGGIFGGAAAYKASKQAPKLQAQYEAITKLHAALIANDKPGFNRTSDDLMVSSLMDHIKEDKVSFLKDAIESSIGVSENAQDRIDNATRIKARLDVIKFAEDFRDQLSTDTNKSNEIKTLELATAITQKLASNRLSDITNELNMLKVQDQRDTNISDPLLHSLKINKLLYEALTTKAFLSDRASEVKAELDNQYKAVLDSGVFKSIDDINKAIVSPNDAALSTLLKNKEIESSLINTLKEQLHKVNTPEGQQEIQKAVELAKKQSEDIANAKAKAAETTTPTEPSNAQKEVTAKYEQLLQTDDIEEFKKTYNEIKDSVFLSKDQREELSNLRDTFDDEERDATDDTDTEGRPVQDLSSLMDANSSTSDNNLEKALNDLARAEQDEAIKSKGNKEELDAIVTKYEALRAEAINKYEADSSEKARAILAKAKLDQDAADAVSSNLQTNTPNNTKGTEQVVLDTENINNTIANERGINLRVNVAMMRLFKHIIKDGVFRFLRDDQGYTILDNNSNIDIEAVNNIQVGDKVELRLVNLTEEQRANYESQKEQSLTNTSVKTEDFDDSHIGIYHGDKLIGFVQQPHAPVTVSVPVTTDGVVTYIKQNKQESEDARKQLIAYRKAVTAKLNSGKKVVEKVHDKGNGNLYTKLKPNGYIDAIRPIFGNAQFEVRPEDIFEGALLFAYHNGKNLELPTSRLTNRQAEEIDKILKAYSNYGKAGQVFQIVKDLRNSYALVPVYASPISESKLTENYIINGIKSFNADSDIEAIVKKLNPFIYTSSKKSTASLGVVKGESGVEYTIGGKRFTHDLIVNDEATQQEFRKELKKASQNITIENINNKQEQETLKKRGTLVTNVLPYKGEYFVQPYIEYTQSNAEVVDNTPTTEQIVQASAPQTNTDSFDSKKLNIERRRQEELNKGIVEFKKSKDRESLTKAVKDWIGRDPYDTGFVFLNVRAALTSPGGFEKGKEMLYENHIKPIEKSYRDKINAKYDAELAALEKDTNTDVFTDLNKLFGFDPNGSVNDENALSKTKPLDSLDINKFNTWLSTNLPQFTVAERDDMVKEFTKLKANGVDAYGMFKRMTIYLFDNASNKTGYHEAFHGVFRNLLTLPEKHELLEEARLRYAAPTQDDLEDVQEGLDITYNKEQLTYLYYEEKMADDFSGYSDTFTKPTIGDKIKEFFNRILKFFKWFNNSSKIDELFKAINTSKYKNATIKSNKPSGISTVNLALDNTYESVAYSKLPIDLNDKFGITGKSVLVSKIGNTFMAIMQDNINQGKPTLKEDTYTRIKGIYTNYLDIQITNNKAGKPTDSMEVINHAGLTAYYFKALEKEVDKFLRDRNVIIKGQFIESEKLDEVATSNDIEDNVGDDEETRTQRSAPTTKGFEEATSIAGIRSASQRMKIFLSSIPILDSKGNPKTDTYGIVEYYDFKKLYYHLELNLTGFTNFNRMLDKLREDGETKPELQAVYTKLTQKGTNTTDEAFKLLRNDFKTNFSKQQLVYTMVKFDTDSTTGKISFEIFDANRMSIFMETISKWESNLRDSTRNTITEFDNKGEPTIFGTNKGEAVLNEYKELIKTKGILPYNKVESILSKVGIEYTPSVLKLKLDQNSSSFRTDILNVLEWYASKEHMTSTIQKAGRIALNRLVGYEVNNTFNNYTSSFNSVENKNIYTVQLPSYASRMVNNIKSDNISDFEVYIEGLLQDPTYRYSNLLKELRASDDYRKSVFKMSFLDGLKDSRGESKGSKFTTMTPKDYASMQLALFQNNASNKNKVIKKDTFKHMYLVPSDKTMSMMFEMIVYNLNLEKDRAGHVLPSNNSEIVEKFYNKFLGEASRTLHNIKIKNDILTNRDNSEYKLEDLLDVYHIGTGKTDGTKNFDIFKGYVAKQKAGKLVDSDWVGIEKLINGNAFNFVYFSKGFNSAMNNAIGGILNDSETTLENIEELLEPHKELFVEQIQKLFKQEIYNTVEEMIEKGVIAEEEGLLKPISINVAGNTAQEIHDKVYNLIGSFALNTWLANIELSDLFNGDFAGYKDLQKRTYQSQSSIKNGNWDRDVIKAVVKEDYNYSNPEEIALMTKTLKDRGFNDTLINSIVSPYSNINVTDAQMFFTPEFYKEFMVAHGEWTPEHQLAHDVLNGTIDTAKFTKEELEAIRTKIGAIKPFYFGNKFNSKLGIEEFVQVKCAVLPLYKAYTDINPLLADKLKEVKDAGADMLAFESTLKAFSGYRNSVLSNDSATIELLTEHFGTQVENPEHIYDASNDSLRQLRMLLLGSIDTNMTYKGRKGSEIAQEIMQMEQWNIEESLRDLMSYMHIAENPDFNDFIKEMVTVRNASINVQEALRIEDGKFVHPLDTGSVATQVQNMLSSIITSRAIKQSFDVGGSGVQATSLGLDYKSLKDQQSNLSEDALKLQANLKWIEPNFETGEVGAAECVMPAWSKKFFNKEGEIMDIDNISDDLKELLMYRIPTEGLHSMMKVKVVGFLPEGMGNFILLPYHVTTQFGADFDFDKMYFVGKEHYYDKKSSSLKAYVNGATPEERYEQYLIYAKNNKVIPKDKDYFLSLPEEFQTVKGARNNKILDNYLDLLGSIENYHLMISPSGFKELEDIKKNYFKDDTYQVNSFFSSRTQRDYKDRNHTGLALKGQSALHVSGHSYAVLMDLSTKKFTEDDKLDLSTAITFDGISSTFDAMFNSKGEAISGFNKLYSRDGSLIADKLSSIMAAILDDIKSPILASLGINKHTIDILATIVRSGHNLDTAIKFIAQPGIKELSRLLDTNYNKIKYVGQKWQNPQDLVKSYTNILNSEFTKAKADIEALDIDADVKQQAIDKLTKEADKATLPSSDITNDQMDHFLKEYKVENGKIKFNTREGKDGGNSFKPANSEQLINYYSFQIRAINNFNNFKQIADNLVEMNKFFSINKQVGPNVEDIISKQEIFNNLLEEDRIIKGFDINAIPTLKSIYNVHLNGLDYLEQYFPFSTEYYMSIKREMINIQSNLDLSKVPIDSKEYMNSFIRAYMDSKGDENFDKFKDIHSNYQKYFVSLPTLLDSIKSPNKADTKLNKEGKVTYKQLANNLFINALTVKIDKGQNKITYYTTKDGKSVKNVENAKYIKVAANRLDAQVRDNIIESFQQLFNNPETKKLATDLIEYSFAASGFFGELNGFSQFISPLMLQELGYTYYRNDVINKMTDGELEQSEDLTRIVDQMIRNNSKAFTPSPFEDSIFNEYEGGKALPNTITTSIEAIKATGREDLVLDKEDNQPTKVVQYIRVYDKALSRSVLYKSNGTDLNYTKIEALGRKGFMLEINPNADIITSNISYNNVIDVAKEDIAKEASDDNGETIDQTPPIENEAPMQDLTDILDQESNKQAEEAEEEKPVSIEGLFGNTTRIDEEEGTSDKPKKGDC